VTNTKEPEMAQLSEYEKGLLDDIVTDLGSKSATDLVTKTHLEPPYTQTTMGSVIDYKLAFYLDRAAILPSRTAPYSVEVSQAEYFSR
jgi:uncharacterized phage-associated protein